jgi:hypothetical protein
MLSPFARPATAAVGDVAFALVALLRTHGHLCNVLTHISSGDWRAVEQAIVAILSPHTRPRQLSNLARNMLELICDDRGVTGPIMRPFFFDAIARIAGGPERKRLKRKIRRLRRRMSSDVRVQLVQPRRTGKFRGRRPGRRFRLDRPTGAMGTAQATHEADRGGF